MIVPWSKLSSSPVEIYLDDIYIIAELIEKSHWQIDDHAYLKKKFDNLLNYTKKLIEKFIRLHDGKNNSQ